MDGHEILSPRGKPKDVLIRGMGETLWQRIGEAAKNNGMSIAEFVSAHFERHGVDGERFIAAKPPALIAAKPGDANHAALAGTLAEAAVSLNQVNGLEPATTRALNMLIRRLAKPAKQEGV